MLKVRDLFSFIIILLCVYTLLKIGSFNKYKENSSGIISKNGKETNFSRTLLFYTPKCDDTCSESRCKTGCSRMTFERFLVDSIGGFTKWKSAGATKQDRLGSTSTQLKINDGIMYQVSIPEKTNFTTETLIAELKRNFSDTLYYILEIPHSIN